MSQAHNVKGFRPLHAGARVTKYPIATGQTLTRGDAVILSSNQVAIALYSSTELLGVVAQDCSGLAANAMVEVWDDPDTLFVGRSDGSMASRLAGSVCDIVGATGAMMVDHDGTSYNVIKLVRQFDTSEDNTATGVRWVFKIDLHAMADSSV